MADDQIYTYIVAIQKDLGELKASIASMHSSLEATIKAFERHADDDVISHTRIQVEVEKLQAQNKLLESAKDRLKWMAVGAGAVFTGIWYLIQLLIQTKGH